MNSWELFKNTTKHPQSWKRRWWLPVAHLFRLQIITLKCLTECSFSLWEVNWAVEKTHWDGGDPQRFAPQFHLGTDLTQNTNQSVITPPLHILGDAFAVPHKCRAGSNSHNASTLHVPILWACITSLSYDFKDDNTGRIIGTSNTSVISPQSWHQSSHYENHKRLTAESVWILSAWLC